MRKVSILLLFLVLGFSVSAGVPSGNAIITYKAVKSDMTGTGYTVLHGSDVVSFPVKILGKIDRGPISGRMIVCRIDEQLFDKTGLLHGMSGSPVYIDGKLAGAIATGWSYAKEPICGITPVEDLLSLRTRANAVSSVTTSDRTCKSLKIRVNPNDSHYSASGISGIDVVESLANEGFQWSGRGNRSEPSPGVLPVPGGMIGVQLVSGDFQFTAFGTVSWKKGQEFIAFGHPFLGIGDIEAPVVSAEVITPVPSFQSGFKLCSSGGAVGKIIRDGSSGVFGRFGDKADMVSVRFTFEAPGMPDREFHFEVIKNNTLTPALVGATLQYFWQTLEGNYKRESISLDSFVVLIEGGRKIKFNGQEFAGVVAQPLCSSFISGSLDSIMNNPYGSVAISTLNFRIKALGRERKKRVIEAWLDRGAVRSGENLVLNVKIRSFQGQDEIVKIDVPTAGLGPGPVNLAVGDGSELQKEIREGRKRKISTMDDFFRELSSFPGKNSIVVAAFRSGKFVDIQGRRLGDLPPSVGMILKAQPRGSAPKEATRRLLWLGSSKVEGMVEGTVKLSFFVKEDADAGT